MKDRFVLIEEDWEYFHIKDKWTGEILASPEDFLNKLNGLHRDVVRGRERNSHVESIVKSSIHDEKTAFGRMVLKQLADKLGVNYD